MPTHYCSKFYLLHTSGEKLYAHKMLNRKTGKLAYRVSKTGRNTLADSKEISDENELLRLVNDHNYAVRAKPLNGGVASLYRASGHSIVRVVKV